MKDLGQLHHFLGVIVETRPSDLFLHQQHYAFDILERAGMTDCKSCSTPVDIQAKLSADLGDPVADPTAYRCLAVPDLHPAESHLCRSASLSSHA